MTMMEGLQPVPLLDGWEAGAKVWGYHLAVAVAVLVIGIGVIRYVVDLLPRVLDRYEVDRTVVLFFRTTVRGLMLAMLCLVVLSLVGVPTGSFIAALGAIGLAVGLALSSSLSNLAWGVLLVLFRPFRVGERVVIGGVEGVVDHVNLMHTHLTTADHRMAVLPNAKVGNDIIVNVTRMGTRRVEVRVGIGFDDDIDEARALILSLMREDARIHQVPEPTVWVDELGNWSVNLIVRCFVESDQWLAVRSSLLERIKSAFAKASIQIPVPQYDVTLRQVKDAA